jgi:hypothetical protein
MLVQVTSAVQEDRVSNSEKARLAAAGIEERWLSVLVLVCVTVLVVEWRLEVIEVEPRKARMMEVTTIPADECSSAM